MLFFFVIAILILIAFLCVKIRKYKNEINNITSSHHISTSTEKATKNTSEYLGPVKTLEKYYNICKAIADSDDALINSDFEILCFLYYITIYTAHCKKKTSNIDIEEYTKGIDAFTLYTLRSVKHPDTGSVYISNTAWVEKRTSFYNSIIKTRYIRGDWMSFDPPKDTGPVLACSIALGDILINPDCVFDYKNAPILIKDFFNARETEKRLSLLCTAIREYTLLIFHHK